MRRGVYFDGWFPGQHCYHPSLPPRRLRMVDDLVDYRADMLVWAAMGGGSLGLPYLEQEAFGPVDPRARFYGFVNDSEFIAECHRHGIAVFGIVFEAQGWEFPVELDEDETTILALNELRGVGRRDWLGLREFSANRYPRLWKPVEHYFPDGLVNSDGESVTDLIDECVARDIHQQPCHAKWVECPDRDHQCYYMDRNNPVWREYLKAVIRIQIDAGVDGVQLDEAELPMGAFQYGACFCRDCMRLFRTYLKELPPDLRDPALDGVDLDTFHYGDWLLARGHDFKTDRESAPLFGDYYRFQCRTIKRYFGELAEYAREYAREQGRNVLISGNFFNCDPSYLALVDDVDVVVTEMRNTTYRQPQWYRYVAGFAAGKDVVVVENPYGGVVPELVEQLRKGRGYDLFRLSLYEGAAFGANMSVPYGAWMGATIEDSFHPPHDLAAEVQNFLADHEHLYSHDSWHEVCVVFGVASTRDLIRRADVSDNITNARNDSVRVPYRVVTEGLSAAAVPFDVAVFADGDVAPDRVDAKTLTRYERIVLPDCHVLTPRQVEVLETCVNAGVVVVVTDRFAENLPADMRDRLLRRPGVRRAVAEDVPAVAGAAQVTVSTGAADVAVNVARLSGDSAAVHLVNYAYDAEIDAVRHHTDVSLRVRLPVATSGRVVYHAPGIPSFDLPVRRDGMTVEVSIPRVGVYGIVELRGDA
ncbi:hypothetical protein ACWDWO_13700 [Actinopolymorpha singaporensis]